MENLVLTHAVVTLAGETLLPAGACLGGATLAELSSRCDGQSCRRRPFAKLPDLLQDLRGFLERPPYDTIFSDRQETAELLKLMGLVQLPEPVIEALDYFRDQDFHTYRHCLLVFALSTLLARHLYPDDERSLLGALAGPSHDLGKICVPRRILQKRTSLTRSESSQLKSHALAGYVLLAYYTGDFGNLTAKVARDHHERGDGSGYPRGVNSVGEMVEIVMLSDIYDALISPRPYRPVSFDNRSALEELTKMAELGQIGWPALKALVAVNRKNRPVFQTCNISRERRGLPPANNLYGQIVEDDQENPASS